MRRGVAKLHNMSESDFLITLDTSSCPFEDFTRGEQLFEIGYNATQAVMPELKQSYEDFVEQEWGQFNLYNQTFFNEGLVNCPALFRR